MTDSPLEILRPAHKFAMMALSILVDESIQGHVDLGSGLHATRALGLEMPTYWKEWLGSSAWDELHRASLCLWAVAPSRNGSVLDSQNHELRSRVFMLYYGLMLALPRIATTGRGLYLSGGREVDTDVREQGWIDPLRRNQGVLWSPVRRAELEEAAILGDALEAIRSLSPYRRLRAAFKCFLAGLQADDPADRIHEFVRTIEGCILPARGKTESQFISRTVLFVGPSEHSWARALFNVRSAVEHLNDRLESVAMPVRDDAIVAVLRLAHESQALARYCLRRIFADSALRQNFQDDQALGSFWELPEEERRLLWGEPLDLAVVRAEFDASLAQLV